MTTEVAAHGREEVAGQVAGAVVAFALAVAHVRRRVRSDEGRALVVALEGHGREKQVAGDADLSRTVGWFTNAFPVRLDPGDGDLDDALSGPGRGGGTRAGTRRAARDPGRGAGVRTWTDMRPKSLIEAMTRRQ